MNVKEIREIMEGGTRLISVLIAVEAGLSVLQRAYHAI